MRIVIKPGTYVVAVSGGVDSMTLLDLLCQKPRLKLIVAHFDHGIREDSNLDRQLVHQIANKHGLPFVFLRGNLGSGASEDVARHARYEFLHATRKASGAAAILTAHHQNDNLETAAHNIFRGTNRLGLSSLRDTKHVKRPLLQVSKEQIKEYAIVNNLVWREDTTNRDMTIKRNYIRHHVLPRLTLEQKHDLLMHVKKARELNQEIDHLISKFLELQGRRSQNMTELERKTFIALPHAVAREIMAAWLRQNDIRQFDRKLLEQLVVAAKTYDAGKAAPIDHAHYLLVGKQNLALISSLL